MIAVTFLFSLSLFGCVLFYYYLHIYGNIYSMHQSGSMASEAGVWLGVSLGVL